MSALLETRPSPPATPAVGRIFRDRIRDWRDADGVAQAAADVLATTLKRPRVFVFRHDVPSDSLVLLASAPSGPEKLPKGSRRKADHSVVNAALQEARAQRSLNYYVEADFVRSLPGETRSALAVPILAGDKAVGVIHLEYASPGTPSTVDEETVDEIAGYLAIAWGTAAPPVTSEVEGTKQIRASLALSGIATSLAQADEFDDVLQRIPAIAGDLLGCSGALLLLRHPDRQMLEVVAGTGTLECPPASLVPLDGTRAGMIFRSGKAAELGPETDGDPLLPATLLATPPRDALLVPVCSAGKTAGLLIAAGSNAGSGFGADDVQLLQALADQAGAAEALRAIAPLRQKISDASLIAEIGRAMTGTLGLDDVLALVVRGAEMLVSGRSAGVALLSDDGAVLSLVAASGSLMKHTKAQMETRETVVGWVASSGETLITENLSADHRGWPLGDGFGPAALVPLESRGQIRGVLLAARGDSGDPIRDDDLDAVRKLGAYAAIAIENARLYQAQTELSATLRQQAVELEKAYGELHTSQERLLVSEKMAALGRVTAGIAHEINSPLGSILNCLQLATTYSEEYRSSASDPEVTAEDHIGIATDILESLKLAEDATRRVAQFVRTIKGQTRMEEDLSELFEPVDTTESTLLMLQHELENGEISVESELERGIELQGDSNKFAVIVQNLVSNAVDAYVDGGGIVSVRLRREGENAVLEVEDRGAGIPEEIRPRIFDYLFTTKDVGHGTGLGLSLVHSIVTSHFRGRIEYRTGVGVGTTFVVTIPLPAES